MRGTVILTEKNIILEWSSADRAVWRSVLINVQKLPDAKFDGKLSQWTLPVTPYHAMKVTQITTPAWFVADEILGMAAKFKCFLEWDQTGDSLVYSPPWLRPYQSSAVDFVKALDFRAVIADDVGLGKTIEALGAVWLYSKSSTVLVVAPANVIYKWEREILDKAERFPWSGKWTAQVISSKSTDIEEVDFLILSYDIMRSRIEELTARHIDLLIFDEIQYIKNYKALRTKAAEKLAKVVPAIIGLTGTPLLNDRPIEMFSWLHMIDPKGWPNLWGGTGYGELYCGGRSQYETFQGATNLKALAERLKGIALRRTKAEVMKDLPVLSVVPVPVKVNLSEYRKVEGNVREAILAMNPSSKGFWVQVLDRMNLLRAAVGRAKLDVTIEWATDFLEGQPQNVKLVIYAHHKFMVDKLIESLQRWGVLSITGNTKSSERDKISQAFQIDSEHRAIVISQAGGVGIDLFGLGNIEASHILYSELEWRPSDFFQSWGRLHRIGQRRAVTAWIIGAIGTIDEYMVRRVEEKDWTISQITDDESMIHGILEGWR